MKLSRQLHTFIACLLFIISFPSLANNLRFNNLDIDDGLPYNSVRSLAVDKQGLVWFGTEFGLAKYDGYTITKYLHDPEREDSISEPFVLDLEVDENNTLWLTGGGNGLSRYNRELDNFTQFFHDSKNPKSLSSNRIFSIAHTGGGYLWLATSRGLDLFNTSSLESKRFPLEIFKQDIQEQNFLRTIYYSPRSGLFIGTNRGLYRFDKMEKTAIPIKLQTLSSLVIRSISEDKSGNLWIGTHNGLFVYNVDTNETRKIPFKDDVKYVLSTLVDDQNDIWVGTYLHGLYQINSNEEMRNFRSDKSNKNSLTHNTILSLLQDKSGLIWAGTYIRGISYFDPLGVNFGAHDNSAQSYSCLPSNDIRAAFALENERVLLGTGSGLVDLNTRAKDCKIYQTEKNNHRSLAHNQVFSILQEDESTFFVGTSDGIDRINLKTKEVTRYGEQFDKPSVFDSEKLGKEILIGSNIGLFILDENSVVREVLLSDGKKLNATVSKIAVDYSQRVWLGTSKGLYEYHPKRNFLQKINTSVDEIYQNSVRSIAVDNNNTLWITIDSFGLFNYHPSKNLLIPFGKNIGLSQSNGFSGLFFDDSMYLWMLTKTDGLYKIDTQIGRYTQYTSNDGLHSNQFNLSSFTKFPDGRVLFGGQSGLNIFAPHDISKKYYTC